MDFPRVFKPREKGLERILGDLETDIMEVVWDLECCCVRDVCDVLRPHRKLAYTTVMTVMARLADKGLLRKEQQAKRYVYRPVYSREELTDMVSKEVLAGLLAEDRALALTHLAEIFGDLDPLELQKLREDIDRAIAERQKGGS